MIGQPSRCAKRTLGITYEAYNLRWSRLLTRVKVGPGATGVRQQKGGVPIAPPLALRPITFICIWSFCWLWVKAANPHPHGVQYPCPSPVRLSAEHRLIGGSRSLGGAAPFVRRSVLRPQRHLCQSEGVLCSLRHCLLLAVYLRKRYRLSPQGGSRLDLRES